MPGILARFGRPEAPFLAVTLVGLAAWLLSHVIDGLTDSPTVVVRTQVEESAAGKKRFAVRLSNISRKAIHGFNYEIFEVEPGLNDGDPQFQSDKAGSALGDDAPEVSTDKHSASYKITQLQPGWTIVMSVPFGGSTPHYRLGHAVGSNLAINLVEPSVGTFFVEHEEELFLSGAILFFALAVLLIVVG